MTPSLPETRPRPLWYRGVFWALWVWAFALAGCGEQQRLSEAHQGVSCAEGACHAKGSSATTPASCMACHAEIERQRKTGKGFHSSPQLATPKSCGEPTLNCHYEHPLGELLPAQWERALAQSGAHAQVTGFPLEGVHQQTACTSCHRPKPSGRVSYLTASAACGSCHKSPHGTPKPALQDCTICHTSKGRADGKQGGWQRRKDSPFDHSKGTGFVLDGTVHEAVPCTGRCHGKPPTFARSGEARSTCSACHKSPHGGSFGGTSCDRCHSSRQGFSSPESFDHATATSWPLRGPHAKAACMDCHKGSLNAVPSTDCGGCHARRNPHGERFRRFVLSDKQETRLPGCATCHSPESWHASAFNHGRHSRFHLRALHAVRDLSECRGCHLGDGRSAFADLSAVVRGAATPTNANIACTGCHRHKDALRSAAHLAFPKRVVEAQGCVDTCHEREGDKSLKKCRTPKGDADPACLAKLEGLGHGEDNPFKLTGAHALATVKNKCRTCHIDKQSRFTADERARTRISGDCATCHATQNPHGTAFGPFASACQRCHDPATGVFRNVRRFDHQTMARYSLQGRHQQVACTARCHPATLSLAARFAPRPMTCSDAACHGTQDAHNGHNGKACDGCHSPTDLRGWIPNNSSLLMDGTSTQKGTP